MKKSTRRSHPSEPTHPHARIAKKRVADGRWEFTSSGRLFTVGSDEARRTAYRAADGELRFLPL
jgi:hypothetical protein